MAHTIGSPDQAKNLLAQIVGHGALIERLLAAQQQQRMHSCFLLVGPDGVGRKKLALALAQNLMCDHPEFGLACGHCGPCLRIAKGQSEGLLVVTPEKTQIKIEQAHHILEFLSLKSISRARVVIVDGAESLNPQAANSLLKVLEEPPADCYFFLIAPSSRHVLPTLRSRAQVVHFSALEMAEMRLVSRAPEWALRASQGSFSRLADLQDKEELESRELAQRFLELWLTDRKSYLFSEWREMIRDRGQALTLSRHVALFLRDAVVWQSQQSADEILNPDKVELVKKLAAIDKTRLLKVGSSALQIENALRAHRDTQLVFEEFWLT